MGAWSIVTGAASGLGFELARLLAADGYQLCLVDYNGEGLLRAKKELEQEFGMLVENHVVDLGEPKAAEKLWSAIGHHRIEILVNNAGFGLYGFFAETDWKKEESMLYLHVLTLTHLTKLVLAQMVNEGSGKILNVASLAAFQPGPLMSIYYASKAYILSFTEALANELKGTGISVTVLLPGWFRTNFQKTTALNSNVEESRSRLHTATAVKVAKKGYSGMMRGKVHVIPGLANKLMARAPRIIPRRVMTSIIRRIQEGLRK